MLVRPAIIYLYEELLNNLLVFLILGKYFYIIYFERSIREQQ